jgi:hypothetical protein
MRSQTGIANPKSFIPFIRHFSIGDFLLSSVKRAKLFLSLAVAFAGLGFFTLFAPIAQEARTTPAVATYQTETPYTSTSTLETVLTTTSTKTVGGEDGFEDPVGDASPAAADIVSVQFEKTSAFLKVVFKVAGEKFSPDICFWVLMDFDFDGTADVATGYVPGGGYVLFENRPVAKEELSIEPPTAVTGNVFITQIPLSRLSKYLTNSNVTVFSAWAVTAKMEGAKVKTLDRAPDEGDYAVACIERRETTQEVTRTIYSWATLTFTSTFTTSSTYNSTYTVNVPVKQGIYIAPILFIAAVAVALAPLMLKPHTPPKPKLEPKPPAEEAFKYCVECGAKLKVEAKFCDECGAKQE